MELQQASLLERLLPELRLAILSSFSLADLALTARVCKSWYLMTQRDDLWTAWVRRNYHLGDLLPTGPRFFVEARREFQALDLCYCSHLPAQSILRTAKKNDIKYNFKILTMMVLPKQPDAGFGEAPTIPHIVIPKKDKMIDVRHCERFLNYLHYHIINSYPLLGWATTDKESWGSVLFPSDQLFLQTHPRLRFATNTDCGQGGATFAEFLDIGFVSPTVLHANYFSNRMWHEIAEQRDLTLDMDWSIPVPDLLRQALAQFGDLIGYMMQKVWTRRGQHTHWYTTDGSRSSARIPLRYLHNQLTFRKLTEPQGCTMIPLVEEARVSAHMRLSNAVEDAARIFLSRMGLPFTVTRAGMILLEDGALARRMTAWLDRCVGGMDPALKQALKGGEGIQKRAGRRVGANKPNRFSLQKNKPGEEFDIKRPSKMLHIALARATKRAVRIALESVVRRFVEAIDDSSYVQAYIEAYFAAETSPIEDWHRNDVFKTWAEHCEIFTNLFLQVPPRWVRHTYRSKPKESAPLHRRFPLSFYYMSIQLAPLMAAYVGSCAAARHHVAASVVEPPGRLKAEMLAMLTANGVRTEELEKLVLQLNMQVM